MNKIYEHFEKFEIDEAVKLLKLDLDFIVMRRELIRKTGMDFKKAESLIRRLQPEKY